MEISEEVVDGIRELVTIGVGQSAGLLNDLTSAHVTLTVPEIRIFENPHENLSVFRSLGTDDQTLSQVSLSFSGHGEGSISLIFPDKSAINLIILLTGEEGSPDEMDVLRVETLLEVGNIIISSVMSAFSLLSSRRLTYGTPIYRVETPAVTTFTGTGNEVGILARSTFELRSIEIEGFILCMLSPAAFEALKASILEVMERGL